MISSTRSRTPYAYREDDHELSGFSVRLYVCMYACVITLRMVSIKYVLASDRISTRVSCSFNSFNVASMAGV